MKFKSSKKLVSLFLAIMMVVTSVPAFAINASAATNSKYLFAYFTGNAVAEQKIRFATSTDGKKFSALNSGNPTVTQKTGTECARDPYLFYSEKENCYYLLATDYDYSHNNWSDAQSTMTVWKSNDLIKWTSETHIDAKNIPGNSFENNLWAPQALWDDAEQKYMVYYSTNVNNSKTVVYSYTTDLLDVTKYSAPQKISDFSFSIIDADITKVGDEYVMFAKYEGQSRIYAAVSSSPNSFSNPVKIISTSESTDFEGPQLYKTTNGYNLAFDNFNNNGNVWVHEFTDAQFADFMSQIKSASSSKISIASYYSTTINQSNDGINPRHGSFISISDEQYNALQTAEFNTNAVSDDGVPAFGINSSNLIARYLVNDATTDTTGKNSALTNNNSVSWDSTQNAAQFTMGNKSYLSLNTSMLNGTTENGFTVSLYAKPTSSNTTPTIINMQGRFFEFTTATYGEINYETNRDNFTYISEAHNGIVQVNNKNYSSHISADPGSTNKYYNDWHLYTVSVSSSGITVYVDGVKSATTAYNDAVTYEGFINNLASCNLLIGASGWPDNTYDGYMKDFRVYNKAITDDEATKLPTQYELDASGIAKEYDQANLSNLKKISSNGAISYKDGGGNIVTENVLYSSQDTVKADEFNGDVDGSKLYMKTMPASNRTVYLYDGTAFKPQLPVITQIWANNKSGVTFYWGINHISMANNSWTLNSDWLACNGERNFTDASDNGTKQTNGYEYGIYKISKDPNGNSQDITYVSKPFNRKITGGAYWQQNSGDICTRNIMTYSSDSFDFGNNYYCELTKPTFNMSADGGGTWTGGANAWNNLNNWNNITFGSSSDTHIYVLNYAALVNKIDTIKSDFNNVVKNEWMYDETSLAKYYILVRDIIDYNPNNFDYSTDSGFNTAVETLKNLVESYQLPTLKTINVEYTFADGSSQSKTFTAGEAIGTVPANTQIKQHGDGTHSTFAWSETHDATYVPHKDVSIHEVMTVDECKYGPETTVDGVTTSTCTVCGYTKTEYNFDYDAYNAAVASANAELANIAKYTADSRNNLQSVLDANKSENAKKQSELDAMTTAIQEAINALVVREYIVNLYYVIDGVQSEVKQSFTGKYGEYFTFTAPEGDYTVEKWTRSTVADGDEKVGESNTSLTGRIVGDADYNVYVRAIKSSQTGSAVVSLKDRLGRVVDNMYVTLTDGKATLNVSVNTANKTITVNDTTMTALDVTFYTLTGFEINGQTVTDGTYEITGDTVITAVYEPAQTFTITTDNTCTSNVTSAYWDQKVTVTANDGTDSTQWYVNDQLVGYGKTYTFRANADATVTCKNETVTATPSAVVTRLSYHNPTANTITAVAQYNVPEGYTFKEAGVLLKTTTVNDKSAVDDINNYTDPTSKSKAKKFVAKNFVNDTNQYVISAYSSKYHNPFYVGAVAYVTYTDADGVEHTAYSSLVTFDYQG